MKLFECVPNISEGRNRAWVDALVASLRAIPNLGVLDSTSDPSHHRSVITLAGSDAALVQALTTITECAVRDIDLRHHRGAHPRLGAVDVVPIIPLRQTTMSEAVALARSIGAELGQRFALPIYLYEAASVDPARRRLEVIRRGQFEGLAEKMATPGWQPDFGPSIPHPSAGATIVGARPFLIAFNVNLATTDVDAARRIARAVRESSGGLPCVKALGLWLVERGIAQVSMNLTDFTRTSVETAVQTVHRLAAEAKVEVLESELIGLIPAAALVDTTPARLGLRTFSADQIVETRLQQAGL
jgi:glutamate formiminotransferase